MGFLKYIFGIDDRYSGHLTKLEWFDNWYNSKNLFKDFDECETPRESKCKKIECNVKCGNNSLKFDRNYYFKTTLRKSIFKYLSFLIIGNFLINVSNTYNLYTNDSKKILIRFKEDKIKNYYYVIPIYYDRKQEINGEVLVNRNMTLSVKFNRIENHKRNNGCYCTQLENNQNVLNEFNYILLQKRATEKVDYYSWIKESKKDKDEHFLDIDGIKCDDYVKRNERLYYNYDDYISSVNKYNEYFDGYKKDIKINKFKTKFYVYNIEFFGEKKTFITTFHYNHYYKGEPFYYKNLPCYTYISEKIKKTINYDSLTINVFQDDNNSKTRQKNHHLEYKKSYLNSLITPCINYEKLFKALN